MTPPLIPDPPSLVRAALAGGKVAARLATSPTVISDKDVSPQPKAAGTERGEAAAETEGQTGVGGRTEGERCESSVMKWERRERRERGERERGENEREERMRERQREERESEKRPDTFGSMQNAASAAG